MTPNELSRAITRLFLLPCLLIPGEIWAEEALSPILAEDIQLEQIDAPGGLSLVVGGGGEVFILNRQSGQVTIWDRHQNRQDEFEVVPGERATFIDLAGDGGMGVLACDPFKPAIYHLGRKGAAFPLIDIDPDIQIEPAAVAATADGRVFILDRRDGDLWRMERDRRMQPMLMERRIRGAGRALLDLTPDAQKIVISDYSTLLVLDSNGKFLTEFKPFITQITGMAADSLGVWLAGEGLEFIPFNPELPATFHPSKLLQKWGVYPVGDIARSIDSYYLISEDGTRLVRFTTSDRGGERP